MKESFTKFDLFVSCVIWGSFISLGAIYTPVGFKDCEVKSPRSLFVFLSLGTMTGEITHEMIFIFLNNQSS